MLRRSTSVFAPRVHKVSVIRQRGDTALTRVCPPLPLDALRYPEEPCITQLPLSAAALIPSGVPGSKESIKPAPTKKKPSRLVSAAYMFEDMHRALEEFRTANGFGRAIAAPQLGYFARVIALNIDGTAHTLINPHWTDKSEHRFTHWDDCFSFPGTLVRVSRWSSGAVKFVTPQGDMEEWMRVDSSTAELLQHEMDHLDGRLSPDVAAPVAVPKGSALRSFIASGRVKADADGRISEVPRDVFDRCREACLDLVSPRHHE